MLQNPDITIVTALPDEVEINRNELAERLKTARGYDSEALSACRERLMQVIGYRCAYIRTPVDLSVENHCRFDFMDIASRSLYRNLQGCQEVFVLALTIGIEVDRLLRRLNITSQAEHFMTDALASAAAESFCDYVCFQLRQQADCVPRFSPGFGDVDISVQEPLLRRLNAFETLGITLNSAFLMTPMKSITAIMGIRPSSKTGARQD